MLTHRNLLAMTLNYLADVDAAGVGDHLLHAAPMSHGSGLYTIPNVAAGATQLIPAARGFDVDEIQHILAYTPNTKFFAAPTMVMRLVDAYAARGSAPDASEDRSSMAADRCTSPTACVRSMCWVRAWSRSTARANRR